MTIRPFRGDDEPALLAAWADALPYDSVDPTVFRRQVLCDPNFQREGLLVAEQQGQVLGFVLALVRRVPLEQTGLQPQQGWITAFGVVPEARGNGIGSALLEAALSWLAAQERSVVDLASYIPNYFVPGIDEQHYATGLAFLLRRGWQVTSRPLSMDANLVLLDPAPFQARAARLAGEGIVVRHLRPTETPELLGFLEAVMPGDWWRGGRELLAAAARGGASYRQISVALAHGELIGYCQFAGEHFGPFGVADGWQGRGIGTVLLAHCLETMRRAGHHHAWVLWTSDQTAARVYSKFGFRETRRFAVLRRRLS
ncbi:MAG: GNAT family N-acetyltransferase [Fimbriimonadaceae bacterium]|nr:GNAT family N-acetyltransferase [Fimbriimonadaceae bacterium]